jgi:hypothetical protein
MTRRNNARVAGAAFLLYIAVGITVLVLDSATDAPDITARLARFAENAGRVRLAVVLSLFTSAMAITLAVTLDALTRDEDAELSGIARGFRLGEGILGAGGQLTVLGVLWLASRPAGGVETEAGLLLQMSAWNGLVCAVLFALGSTLFCWLFVRGRLTPMPLAWLGLGASLLLVVALPLQIAGVVGGLAASLVWLPMAAFEIPLGFWLIFRGVETPIHPSTGSIDE